MHEHIRQYADFEIFMQTLTRAEFIKVSAVSM